MANNQPFDITDDTELIHAVRTETGYGPELLETNSPEGTDLTGLVESAKRDLALRADITSFYEERGTAVALLGVTCIKAKSAVENVPVRAESIAAQDTTFRTTDGTSFQINDYERLVEQGLSSASSVSDTADDIHLTNTFFHG